MGINKLKSGLIVMLLPVMGILASCSGSGGSGGGETASVSREVYEDLQHKYDMLKESVDGTISANEKARMELNSIMAELNSISGRTLSLQKNVESGIGKNHHTTAEQISKSIAEIKKRLNAVPTKEADKQTQALLKNLRQTVALNEQEISRLNSVIKEKDQQITSLDNELTEANKKLQQTLKHMQAAEMENWLATGDELIEVADLLPNVKGHGNMKSIKKAKLTILLRAKAAYSQAHELGSTDALAKIQMTDEKYNEAYSR